LVEGFARPSGRNSLLSQLDLAIWIQYICKLISGLFFRLSKIVDGGQNKPGMKMSVDSFKDFEALDSSPSTRRPDSSRSSRSNGSTGTGRRSASCKRVDAVVKAVDQDLRIIVKHLNIQMLEQKKAMAKMSKLCLGALTAVDQLETKQKTLENADITKHQPMERFKKLSEDTLKLNTLIKHVDHHLGQLEAKVVSRDEIENFIDRRHLSRLGTLME
jgi:hypothetical protein